MMQLLSKIMIIIALGFMFFGVIGLFRFKDFYSRILISSKIETVGFLTLMTGLMLWTGLSFATLKILLIILMVVITNPLSTHAIARSALLSDYKITRESKSD